MRLFWHITLPQLRPITVVVVVGISVVNSLKTFDIVWLLTQGGPGTASETLALTMYRETFTLNRYGTAPPSRSSSPWSSSPRRGSTCAASCGRAEEPMMGRRS